MLPGAIRIFRHMLAEVTLRATPYAAPTAQHTQPRFQRHYICRFTRIASALTPMNATPIRTSEIGQPSESTKCCAVK